jgi:ferredoxin-NADP reductase
MTDDRVKLKKSKEVAEGTMAFHFEKPSGFEYKAGQFVRLTLLDPPETDAEGNGRTFTLASAPHEENLMVATRMRDSAFKRVLKSMPLGTQVELRGPFGALTLHDDANRPAVFVAGGIGITPFRSIAIQAARVGLPHRILLFYSNRRPEDAAFLEELKELESKNSNYRFIPTMTRPEDSEREWLGETGYINSEMLGRYIGDLKSPIYYTAGPPAMVDAMEKLLAEAGVDRDNVRTERFKGY